MTIFSCSVASSATGPLSSISDWYLSTSSMPVVPVVALVNDHFDCGRFDPLVIDLHALVILLDRDGAAGPDVDLVALILDLALIIGVADLRENVAS